MGAGRTLYHRSLADMGPTTITVKTGPTKSKYSKPNSPKPDFASLTINGEDFYYTIDSEQCAEFLKQHVGKTLTVIAEGSHAECTLTAVGAPASQLQQPASKSGPHYVKHADGTPPPVQQQQRPAAEQPGDTMTNVKHFIARNRVLAVIALEAAYHTKLDFEAAKNYILPTDMLPVLFTSMLFGASANGFTAANQGLPIDLKFRKVEGGAA